MIALLAVLLLEGCGAQVCTQALCFSGVSIAFTGGGLSGEGIWTLGAEVDGDSVTCEVSLPAGGVNEAMLCQGELRYVRLELSDDRASIESLSLAGVNHHDAEEIALTIALDGEPVYSAIHPLAFGEMYYANGEECDGTGNGCRSALVEVSVPEGASP